MTTQLPVVIYRCTPLADTKHTPCINFELKEEIYMDDRKTRLEEKAYEYILQRIIDGTYAVGDFVNQRDLTEELHMSRTPIKAALSRLSGEGYIRVFPYSGAFVSHYHNETKEIE